MYIFLCIYIYTCIYTTQFFCISFNFSELLHLLSDQVKKIDLSSLFLLVPACKKINVMETLWRECDSRAVFSVFQTNHDDDGTQNTLDKTKMPMTPSLLHYGAFLPKTIHCSKPLKVWMRRKKSWEGTDTSLNSPWLLFIVIVLKLLKNHSIMYDIIH